jgi:chemotaxis signal transduction protein
VARAAAAPAVLGVVSLRGRMRTVLDPAALLGGPAGGTEGAPGLVVVLRGDEQLALAVAHAEDISAPADLTPADADDALLRAAFRHDGKTVRLLDPAQLFAAATRGAERRRQRLES